MKLRKIVTLILALAMLLTMAACTKDTEKDTAADSDKEVVAEVETNTENGDQQAAADTQVQTDATPNAGQLRDVPASREEESEDDKLGYVSGATYRNPYFDLTFTAPENATYYDDQTLLAMSGTYNLPEDVNEAFAAQLEQNGAYVMMVVDLNGAGANILVKKTPDSYKGVSEEELYLQAKPEMEAQLLQNNMSGSIALGSTTFLGETRAVLETTMQDAGMVQKQLYLVEDEYTCIITTSANSAETLDAIMALFTR